MQGEISRHFESLSLIRQIEDNHPRLLRGIRVRDLDDMKRFLGHCGACRPGERSHSDTCASVSACRAWCRTSSRAEPRFMVWLLRATGLLAPRGDLPRGSDCLKCLRLIVMGSLPIFGLTT